MVSRICRIKIDDVKCNLAEIPPEKMKINRSRVVEKMDWFDFSAGKKVFGKILKKLFNGGF